MSHTARAIGNALTTIKDLFMNTIIKLTHFNLVIWRHLLATSSHIRQYPTPNLSMRRFMLLDILRCAIFVPQL